jgi:predicted component of type VI protein secretion system
VVHHQPPELISISDGPSILLDKPILLMGRHLECDVQLNSRKVSRRHCCIAQVNDYLVIRDLDSTNGIRVNGQKVAEGLLRPGDEITIGNYEFRVSWPGHPRQPESSIKLTKKSHPPHLADSHPLANKDLLESCDEPIPLAEPYLPPPRIEVDFRKTLEDEGPSLILPDQIDLAPSSDIMPRDR